jgi:type I restriction enzyme S subunit
MAVTDMTQERRIVARAARVPTIGQDESVFSMDLVKVKPNPTLANEYLYGMLRFSAFPDEVKQHANGANVLHLNPARIEGYEFVLPPEEISAQYAEICSFIYRQSDVFHVKNDNLRRTRDMLLPKLISGDVDVTELDLTLDISEEG